MANVFTIEEYKSYFSKQITKQNIFDNFTCPNICLANSEENHPHIGKKYVYNKQVYTLVYNRTYYCLMNDSGQEILVSDSMKTILEGIDSRNNLIKAYDDV